MDGACLRAVAGVDEEHHIALSHVLDLSVGGMQRRPRNLISTLRYILNNRELAKMIVDASFKGPEHHLLPS